MNYGWRAKPEQKKPPMRREDFPAHMAALPMVWIAALVASLRPAGNWVQAFMPAGGETASLFESAQEVFCGAIILGVAQYLGGLAAMFGLA
jgi:hypothetical protein